MLLATTTLTERREAMRFYTSQHQFYCGVDLHARSMYVCILNREGKVMAHKQLSTNRNQFLKILAPYREDIVVGVECVFLWYWLADLCAEHSIPFVLGHALYMKAIHGGKAKNDRIDSEKMAVLLRGGMFPIAYVYPRKMRSTRDLLRRRNHLMRKRAELIAHVQNTNSQYNLPEIAKKIAYKDNREGVAERFEEPCARKSVELDLRIMDYYDKELTALEYYLEKTVKAHDAVRYYLLRTVPGIGRILAMVILYEIHNINRFPTVQDFASYARLIKCARESAGKRHGTGGSKIGNMHLRWAFSEAAALFLRSNPQGQKYVKRLERKHGKGKAMTILAHKLGRAVYFMLRRREAFDRETFFAGTGANQPVA
jgi:transposase